MAFDIALFWVLCFLVVIVFVVWYVFCLFEIFYECERPSSFFSNAHPSSGLFTIVTFMIVVCGLAKFLQWVTG